MDTRPSRLFLATSGFALAACSLVPYSASEGDRDTDEMTSPSTTDGTTVSTGETGGTIGDVGAPWNCGGDAFLVILKENVECEALDLDAAQILAAHDGEPAVCSVNLKGYDSATVLADKDDLVAVAVEDCRVVVPAGVSSLCSSEHTDVFDSALAEAAGVPPPGDGGPVSEGSHPLVIIMDAVELDEIDGAPIVLTEPGQCKALGAQLDATTWHAAGVCRTTALGLSGSAANLEFRRVLDLDKSGHLAGTIGDWLRAYNGLIDEILAVGASSPGRPIVIVNANAWRPSDEGVREDLARRVLHDIAQAAGRAGVSVTVVAAAGNASLTCEDSPGTLWPGVLASEPGNEVVVTVAALDLDGHPGPLTPPGGLPPIAAAAQTLVAYEGACYPSVASSWGTGLLAGLLTHMRALAPTTPLDELVRVVYDSGACVTRVDGAPVFADYGQHGLNGGVPVHAVNICRALVTVGSAPGTCEGTAPVCQTETESAPPAGVTPMGPSTLSSSRRSTLDSPMLQPPSLPQPGPGLPEGTVLSPLLRTHAWQHGGTTGSQMQEWQEVGPTDPRIHGTTAAQAHDWMYDWMYDETTNPRTPKSHTGMMNQCLPSKPSFKSPSPVLLPPPDDSEKVCDVSPDVEPTPRERRCDEVCAATLDGSTMTIFLELDEIPEPEPGEPDSMCELEFLRGDQRWRARLDLSDLAVGQWYEYPYGDWTAIRLVCSWERDLWIESIPVLPKSLFDALPTYISANCSPLP